MKILVCGGAGFIGSAFIRNYLQNNQDSKIINLDILTIGSNLQNLQSVENNKNYPSWNNLKQNQFQRINPKIQQYPIYNQESTQPYNPKKINNQNTNKNEDPHFINNKSNIYSWKNNKTLIITVVIVLTATAPGPATRSRRTMPRACPCPGPRPGTPSPRARPVSPAIPPSPPPTGRGPPDATGVVRHGSRLHGHRPTRAARHNR